MPAPIEVRKVPLHNVSDASELAKLIDDGVMEADRVIAVIGKTEGNGGINDYTRIIADRAFREVLEEKGTRSKDEVKQIPIVWSGGTDGVISPHATIFATLPEDKVEKTDEPRLTVGYAMSDVLLPEDIGRVSMVEKVAAGVKKAMEAAGITDPADVHYVQTKTPLLTIDTIRDAHERGQDHDPGGAARLHGHLQRHDGAGHRGGARRDRDAEAGAGHARPVAVLVGGVLLLGRRAGPGADRRRRQRPRARRQLPGRPLGHEGRPGPGRHLGRHPRRRHRAARAPAPHRPRRPAGQRLPQVRGRRPTARCAAAATRCSTTPTSPGTARSRRPSAA